jgi:AcrR family transcriptional regulator
MSDRREEILAVARDIFAERGVKATTVREIGSKVGMLSGSLYHHFSSKLEIVDAILADFCDEVLGRYEEINVSIVDPIERLSALSRYAFALMVTHRSSLVILYNEARHLAPQPRFAYLAEFDKRVQAYWVDTLEEGVVEGRLNAELNARLFYRVVRDAIAGAVHWYTPSRGQPIEGVADAVIAMLLHGVTARAA